MGQDGAILNFQPRGIDSPGIAFSPAGDLSRRVKGRELDHGGHGARLALASAPKEQAPTTVNGQIAQATKTHFSSRTQLWGDESAQ